jgi:hypothetical protein
MHVVVAVGIFAIVVGGLFCFVLFPSRKGPRLCLLFLLDGDKYVIHVTPQIVFV